MSDFEFLSVEFEFEGGKFYSLIRKKKKLNCIEYHVTVMNGKLEKLLYGNHIIRQVDGTLDGACLSDDKKLLQLKEAVTRALENYLLAEQAVEANAAGERDN